MQANGFGEANFPEPSFSLDFSALDSGDVLNDFDFDTFLHNTDDGTGTWGLDPNLTADGGFGLETTGVE